MSCAHSLLVGLGPDTHILISTDCVHSPLRAEGDLTLAFSHFQLNKQGLKLCINILLPQRFLRALLMCISPSSNSFSSSIPFPRIVFSIRKYTRAHCNGFAFFPHTGSQN